MSTEYEPRLTEPLQAAYQIREGQPVKLSCRFDAQPRPDILWLKDGTPIDFEALGISRDFKVVKEVDYTALLIKEAFPEDTGSYTVVIHNSRGEARSYTQLIVEEFFCRTPESEMSDTPSKPVFVQPLRDVHVQEGETLKLHAALNAYPEPEIIWYRNEIPLKNSHNLRIKFDGQLCTLIKDRCEKENDTGMYRVTAVNSVGQAESTCQVVVQPNPTPARRERIQSNRSALAFIEPLRDQTVNEGHRLNLRIRLDGQIKPQITWYKDNQPIKASADYLIRQNNDIYSLEIARVSPKDAGVYQVKAATNEGEIQSTAVISVLPTPVIVTEPMMVDTPTGSSPEFRQLFADRKSTLGSTVQFEARVFGTPPLKVSWLFNGVPINFASTNQQHYQQHVFNDTYTLTINNLRYDDIGRYTLHVENDWGKATCTAELFIPSALAPTPISVPAPTPPATKFLSARLGQKMHLGSPSSGAASSIVQTRTITRRITGNDYGQISGVASDIEERTMLSDLLVKKSPSPPRQRTLSTYQSSSGRTAITTGSAVTTTAGQTHPAPVLSPFERTQSLTRHENYRHIRQYPKALEIFIPVDQNQGTQSTITRTYELEIEKKRRSSSAHHKPLLREAEKQIEEEYIKCLNDVTDEFERHQRKRNKTFESKETFEAFAEVRHYPTTRTDEQSYYQRSLSEGLLHQRMKPFLTQDITISDENLNKKQYHFQSKERLKPIRIHSSNNSLPGETSVKYVRTEPTPLEIRLPKPEIITNQGEHSSTIVKDVRQATRKIVTNIHQAERRKTIEGIHELRIIETPIRAEETRPVEFTVPKPLETQPAEHTSTLVVKSKKGRRFHTLDISEALSRERTLSGEHELRVISEPIRPSRDNQAVELLFPKLTLPSTSSHHSATIVKQTRTPKSSLILENIQTTLKGEHELRRVEQPIQSGPAESVELIVPKSVTDVVEHTTTVVTETQPHRRVLEVTGSGKAMQSEHERKYYHDVVRVEEALEVKLPKTKVEQVEHSTTVVKHSRGHPSIIEIDTTGKTIEGEHELRIVEEAVESKADAMQLLIAKPQVPAEHSTTIIKGTRGKSQVVAFERTQPIPGEHQTKFYDQPVESLGEIEVLFPKQQSAMESRHGEHTSTYVRQVQGKPTIYYDHLRSSGEHTLTRVNTMTEVLETEQEESVRVGEHSTTFVKQTQAKYEPVELVVDRPIQLPSVSTLFADIQGPAQVTSIRPSTVHLTEDSSTKLDLDLTSEQSQERYDEMELVLEKPIVQDSSTTVFANIQPGLELKSMQSTPQVKKVIEESTSSFTLQRERESEEELLELRLRKPRVKDSSSVLLANIQSELGVQGPLKPSPYVPTPVEESTTAITMDMFRQDSMAPVELIIPRIDMESSTSTILAQVSPAIAGLRARIDVPVVEKSTSNYVLEQKRTREEEVELIMPKPKRLETSSSTMIAGVRAALEMKDVRPSEFQPETATSTFFFEQNLSDITPEAVELRLKPPTIGDSSSTVLANVKATFDTEQVHVLGTPHLPYETSTSEVHLETRPDKHQPSEVELILPRPEVKESTSVVLADVRATLDTSQRHLFLPPPPPVTAYSTSEILVDTEQKDSVPVELHFHRQPSSHTLVATLEDKREKFRETYILGTNQSQEQPYGYQVTDGSSVLHVDLNKPVELVFNVDGTTTSTGSQQRRDYSSKMLTSSSTGMDNSSTLITEMEPRQFQPVEFLVSGGLSGYNTSTDQYSTVGTGGYTTTTTTTTTRRTLSASRPGGYEETTNTSVARGIRPYDQVDLVIQPDTSYSSSSRMMSATTSALDQRYPPYFVLSLHDQSVREGSSVLFEVIVSAQPAPEIVWDKDGELITDDSAFRIEYYGDGRATLYIPEAFFDDQGYYTCTATNELGTCRTTARLTIEVNDAGATTRRSRYDSSTVRYQRQTSGPRQMIETYRYYSSPSRSATRATEETRYYQVPTQSQQSEITYSIQGSQPKFQPVQFLVTTSQDSAQPNVTTTTTEDQSITVNPYQVFGTQLRSRPFASSAPSYGDDNTSVASTTRTMTTTYSQQPYNTNLRPMIARQPGPTYSQTDTHDLESMQTESDVSSIHLIRSAPQPTASTTTTTTTSYIASRPTFSKPLETVDAVENATVQITVHFSTLGITHTRPQIEWFHHGQPIVPDNEHYRIIEDSETSTLEIINLRKSDAGQVWCVATTPSGSATTTCTINVADRPTRTHRRTVTTQQQVVPQETVYETRSTHADIDLHHQQVPQSQYYAFQTSIQPQQQQVPSVTTTTTTYSHQQQIPVQSNIPQAPPMLPDFNQQKHYSELKIKFVNGGLKDTPLYTGVETVLECQFTGQPEKVQWFRNEVEIINNPQQLNNRVYHVTNLSTGTSRLIIKPTLDEDAGTYTVKVTGPQGEETSSAKLIPAAQYQTMQRKKIEQTQRKALVQELEEKQLKRMKPSKSSISGMPRNSLTSYATSDDDVFYDATQTTAPRRQPTAPTVTRPLKDVDVKEGQPIQISCQVQGFPKSEVIWLRNNIPLPLSQRHKVAYDGGSGTITLRINESRPEDSGVYTVIARNPQGEVFTSARINVQETPAIDETSYVQPDAFKYIEKQPSTPRSAVTKPRRESDTSNLSQQRPAKILKTPMNTTVVEGGQAQFFCQVDGNPKPKIAWLKNNKPLMAGPRFHTYFDQPSRTAVLRINDVSKDDQGYYTCIVDNPLNSDQSTATLQVIPESKIDQRSYVEVDAFKYLAPEKKQGRIGSQDDRTTSGVDSESYVNPESFRYLENKRPIKEVEDNVTIDDRPIVDLDAFRYLEAKQVNKPKKRMESRSSIDDTPIIAPDAFRYLEKRAEAVKAKKNQDTGPSIDETPQVDLNAFLYLERKAIPKKPEDQGPSIDESSIVNPEAFKYLEQKPKKKKEDTGPSIDESPMVNPEAFRYLERRVAPQPRDTTPIIDTTPLVNPDVFRYLEKPSELPRVEEGPTIDTRPIVPQEAFRWLERPKPVERAPEGPAVDESSYVNPQAFRYIEAKPKPKVDQGPAVDQSSYVNPQAFRYLEAPATKKKVDEGPAVDTQNYVNPELFAQFERKPAPAPTNEESEVKRAPRVVQPLKNTQVYEGKPVALVAVVDGYPVPQLTWLKDGAELPASTRVTTNYDIPSKTAWIRIDNARPDDSAVYTLLAHNPAGNVRTDARLNIVPSSTPIDDTSFVPVEAFARVERPTGPLHTTMPATTGVDDTSFVNPELFRQFEAPARQPNKENFTDEVVVQVPARFLVPLRPLQAPESSTVVLDAVVEGTPIPTFTWLKDQLPLKESNRFITNYDLPSKRVTLTIKDVRESDTGTYTLLASNGPQLQHSSAVLQIIGAPTIDQSSFIPMDVFRQLERPQNQTSKVPVQAGVDQTSYVAQPDRFAVFDQIQPNRRPLNDFGGVDETPLVSMEKIRLLEIPSRVTKQPDVEEKLQAPTVLAPLQPIDAQEGTPIVLTAKIDGTPMPNFTWFKDNAPLVASSRFTTYYDIPSKLIVLQIGDARPTDTGVYTVRADNKAGDVSTSAQLNVSNLPSIRDQSFIPADKFRQFEQGNQPRFIEDVAGVDERPLVDLTKLRQLEIKPAKMPEEEVREQAKPTVIIPLRDVQVAETQPVVLSAQVDGKPQPQFTWFKNDQPLAEGNRFRTHYDIPSKTIFLTIAGAREDDSGTYRVVAQNPSGQDETSCEVTVDINQPNIDQRSFVPQNAFDRLEKPATRPLDVTSGVDQTSFFNQDLFRPLDERAIKHPSAFAGGEDSDAAMPISAPRVVVPLRPLAAPEGQSVLFTTQVEGYPLPQFTWFHNDQPLMASNRITSHYDMLTKRCYLQILDARPDDAGTYELLAENPAGQDRTRTELTITPVSKIDQTGYVPYDKFSTLEFKPRLPSDLRSGVDSTPFVSGEIFRLLEAKPTNMSAQPEDEQNVPLEVIVPLKPAVAQEGQPVILTTKIRGRPIPQFTWLRNNQPLLESTRFQTHYDFPSETLVLEVSDIWPHDEGLYTVIAENPKTGERVETSAPLTVRTDATLIDRTAFVSPDSFRNLEDGTKLRTNFIQPGVDTNSFISPEIFKALEQGKPVPMDTQDKHQPLTPPRVIVPLKPVNCNEGQPIIFTAKVEGTPQPTFTWFKNGQPLQESNRFWSHYDVPSKTVLLQINGARPDDTGTYVLVAENPVGRDQTQANVNVSSGPAIDTNPFVSPDKFTAFDQPTGRRVPEQSGVDTTPFVQPERFAQLELKAPPPTKEDMEQLEAPQVIVPLQSTQIKEGAPALLRAKIVGRPTPTFSWLKDGAPLAASNRLRTRYDIGTKQVLLQINDVRPHDVGEYCVIAKNPAGEDSTVCSLTVVPDRPGVDDRAFVPEDRFRGLEHPEAQRRPLEIVPGVDTRPFIEPERFLNLKPIPSTTQPEDELQEPKRAPKVIVPLANTDMEEQMPVIFTTTIDAGSPMATFEWFKNGQPLREGNRFTTKYDILSKVLTLQILAARPDDQGTYTVRASNPSGQDETSCQLTIRPTTSIDTRPFVQPEKFANLELKAPPPTKEDLARPEAPKVVIPLEDTQLKEGAPVLLTAKIIGRPTPDFVWLKDNAPLSASNRLRTRYDIGTKQVLLQINDVRPDDVGEYRVVATNPAGQASTVCKLNVIPDRRGPDMQPFIEPEKFLNLKPIPTTMRPEDELQEPKRAPKVIVPLSDTDMEEQMPVIFTTTIDAGFPMATFEWFKDGQPLREGNRFTTKYDILSKVLTLQILASRPDDQGTYTVRATNPSGTDQTSCKLNVRPTSSIDTRPYVEPTKFNNLELKAPPPTKEDLAKPEPPKVIIPLEDTQLKEGSPVLLTAKIIGRPTPDFVWLKDDKPLSASNRLRTRYDIGTKQVLLQINDVRPDDVGQYRVVATNPAGQASTVCKLNVIPDRRGPDMQPFIEPEKFLNLKPIPTTMRPEDELKEPKRPPKVIVPLSDTDMEEQMPVIFTTTIDAGVPMATFEWFKDGQPLREANRFTTKYDILSKVLTLQILATRPDDQGTYTVRATNPSGKAETSCKLTIRPTSGIDTRPFVEPERFSTLELKAPPPTKEELAKPEPPKVIIPLEDTQLKEGAPVLLTAKIIGRPTPDFVWLKDNQPLNASNRLRTRYDIGTKQVLLQINDVRPDDVGEYRVVATNPAGQASTVCKLNVIPDRRGPDMQPFIEPEKFLNLKPIPTTMRPEDELKEPKRPPKVIVPLADTAMEEQMPVIFTTTIDAGVPMATFEWFKDGQPLREGNRFTTKYDILSKVLTLQILASRPDDQGTYTVRASNPSGKDETSCKLTIRPTTSIDTRPFVEPEKFSNLEVKAPPPTKEDLAKPEPPKVIIPLEDTQLKEGSPVLLTAKIIGRPTPDFVWLKDDKPLSASNRLRTRYDIGTKQVLLQINDVRPDDVGQYRVVATNPAGQASTVCKLNVIPDRRGPDMQPFIEPEKFLNLKPIPTTTRPEDELKEPKRPPKVIVPLADTVMEEQMPVIFTTTIDAGVPMATFEWFKDGQPLREGNRFTTKYDILNKVLTLHILASRPDDQGTYTVRATNPVGKDETSCKLTIRPTASIDTRPFVQPEKFAPLEVKAPPPTKEDLQTMEPPKVIIPLEDTQLKEGMPVLLSAKIIGRPTPDFVWLKDNQPLNASNRLRTRYDIGTKQVLLQINDVRPDDVGEYRVVATNPAGQASTVCKLNIIPDRRGPDMQPFIEPEKFLNLKPIPTTTRPEDELKEPKRPPKVIVPLADTVMEEQMPVIFTTTIDAGVPMATFEWFKDGQPLREGNRFTTKYDIPSKVLTLHILTSRPDDQGTYTVRASNPSGKDETSCKLTIRPTPSIDTRPFVQPEKFAPLEVKAPPPTKEDLQKMEPPKVIIPLEDKQLKEGSPALLQSKIIGRPTPDFVWLKDDKPLPASNRLRTRYDIGTKQVLLQINDVRPDDVGEYRVVATNPAGQASTVCKLNIIPDRRGPDMQPFIEPEKFLNLKPIPTTTRPEDELKQPKRPPKVIVPLADTVMEEQMPVIFTTTIDAGVPMATFEWFKDGQPLREGNRFTTKYDIPSKVLTLQILASRPDDQGTYTVRATNPVGKDETSCKLTIRPTPSIDTRPFVQPEKFAPLEVKAPPPTKEDLQKMEPPKVIIPLEDKQLKEGSPALLQSKIIGRPTPDFVWLKDDKPLPASNRLRTRYDIGTKQVLLQINDVRPDDAGEYRVVATNPAGQASTVCKLNIIPDRRGPDMQPFIEPEKFLNLKPIPTTTRPEDELKQPKRPPKVIVPLADTVMEEQMPVIFTTTIDAGVPMATFEWFKDGQPLREGNRFTTKYDIPSKVLTLHILASRPDDQGTYTVRATNPVGKDETSCKLTIRPTPSIDTRPFVQPEKFAPLEVKAPPPTKEDLQTMEPPKVIIPLEDMKLKEGAPALLQSKIIGRPTPDFVWLKDDKPLPASNRLRTRYDIGTKQVLLQINDVRPEDVGVYRVIATNPAGQDSTQCTLNIIPDRRGPDTQPLIEPEKFLNLKPIPTGTRPEDEKAELMRPPKVIVPLADSDLEEMMPVILTATIDAGVPMATFTWLKNGQPLLEGNRFTTTYDIPTRTITLQILNSRPDDQGTYTVRAVNPVGSDETSCKLTIRPTSSIDTRPFVDGARFRPLDNRQRPGGPDDGTSELLRPPKVLVPMNNVRLTESEPILLKSIIDAGYPMGQFTWLKDGRPLVESNRYRANYDINTRTATLFINAARPTTDTGRYTVHVENIVGKDQTTGEVNVEGTPGIDNRPFVEPSKFGKFDGMRGPILQPLDSLRDRENLPPWIRLTKELEDQTIDETKAAQLVCGVDAHPAATINWFKDGQPLIVSQRFIPFYEQKTGVVYLNISPVYAADSGQYTMVARNIAGEVSTKCTLRIEPTANVEENPLVKFTGLRKTPQQPTGLAPEPAKGPNELEDGQKPYFIKVPVDREVPEGQLVRLDYIPAGRPEPTLTWYRNGVPLKPNDADHRDVINEGGVHSLLILNPKLGPPVEYQCVAKNKYGEASFPVRLNVVERGANIPPFFIELLYDIIIIEGQDARLDACAEGYPEPKVAWEKEGQPLTPNKEYKMEFEGPKTTLYIRGAKMTDAGFYQCTATSPAGTAITKCRVTVIPLSEAGQFAKDFPQMAPPLLNKPGVTPEVRPEELYKLPRRPKKSDNPLDEVKRRGLKVLPEEVLSAVTGGLEEYPEEEMYSKDRPQPPKFKVHIKSQLNLNEDDHCIFEAKLIPVRDPMMRVQWFKNGKVLHHASRIIPRYDFADVSLEFLWTFPVDDGIYECVATNPYGEDRTRAELKCRPKRSIIYNTQLPEGMEGVSKLQMLEDEMRYTASMIGLEEKVQEKEPKAPEFIMQLEDLTADEGDNAKFIAKVDGHPRPRVTWSINNIDIATGSHYKLVFDGLVHYLDIPRTRQYDAGIIRCIAKNGLGQAESVATLTLRPRQDYRSGLSKTPGGIETGLDDSFDVDIEERLRLRSQNRQRESVDDRARRPSTDRLHPLHSKALDRMSWKQTEEKVGEPPNFTRSLLPLKAKEGSKVVVSVEFTGNPPPTVSWYRDGFMVEDSEDFKIITTATQSTLTIKHAFIIDSGLYTVKLFNPMGIKQCQAAIRILPIIAEDQTPRFLDVPHDTEILAGDPVRFQCRVEGEPFPTVSFYREDEPVDLNDKRFRAIQEGDVFTLLLFEALPADSGQYEAVAENSVGKANTRFTLTVIPRAPDGKKASIVDDPKLIHKVPYLEKPLEDVRVKEGESATLECIIPASYGSDVKWYKGTSEWQIKPSKFFKPKSDGTKHQLFILEAYAEDEGLYKCVVSNPVGTTATTARLIVDHDMQVPEFVRGFSNLTTYEGEEVRFEVEVRGDPTPTITWYRDGELIRDSPDFQIFTEGNRSIFYISEVFMEDQGLFTCKASNAAGSSDCSARLTIEPRPQ